MTKLLLIPAIVLSAGVTQGQTLPDSPLTLRAETRLVEINVIATDRNGPAEHLTKDDFTVFDEGKKQKIAFFAVNDRRALASSTVPIAQRAPNEFTNRPEGASGPPINAVLLVWDTLNTGFADQAWARRKVMESLHVVRPGDRVGLYILGISMQVLQDFTDDSAKLLEAMDKNARLPDTMGSNIGGGSANPAIVRMRMEITRKAAQAISNHLAHIPGRKSVVWVGAIPPPGLLRSEIAIYPVDARGLVGYEAIRAENRSAPVAPPSNPIGIEAMRAMAERTGGVAFVNTNDLRGAIDKAISDTDLTYSLGFYPDSAAPGRPVHTLKVTAAQHGVGLRYRSMYLSVPDAKPTPEEQIADAVLSPIDATQIAISAGLEPDGRNIRLALTMDPADIALETSEGRHQGGLDYTIVQRTAGGDELGRLSGQIKLDFNQVRYEAYRSGKMTLNKLVEVQTGLSEIKVVVFDRTSGQIGSLSIPVKRETP